MYDTVLGNMWCVRDIPILAVKVKLLIKGDNLKCGGVKSFLYTTQDELELALAAKVELLVKCKTGASLKCGGVESLFL